MLGRTLRDLQEVMIVGMIEGDQATTHDVQRIRATGCEPVQINTGTGCHLEADMLARCRCWIRSWASYAFSHLALAVWRRHRGEAVSGNYARSVGHASSFSVSSGGVRPSASAVHRIRRALLVEVGRVRVAMCTLLTSAFPRSKLQEPPTCARERSPQELAT